MSTVLLIDDNALQLQTREAILRNAGMEVCVATTAESALALLRSRRHAGRVDVIVTDHILPGSSGAVFVRELRRIDPDVPVLAISGMAEAENEYHDLNVTFRQKPIQPQELIAQVRALAGR